MGKRHDVNNRMFLRPSPNEETKLLQDEKQKLRRLRLQQVRQQEKILANKARKKFKEKEKKEINILENELKKKWEEDITEKRNVLENQYYENVAHVGEGHQAALMCDDGAPKERSLEDEIKVSERYKEALKRLREDDAEKAQIWNEKTIAKNKAMEIERLRAERVAALQPPVPDIAQNLENIQKHRHKQSSVDQYSSTYYHIPRERVEKADPNVHQIDARDAAIEEEERINIAKEESERNFSEQMEKARLRHQHARSKLMLEKDHDKLLVELEHFERIDRQRRQEIVSKIPKHVFEPPHRRIEAMEERQHEIEHAFEDMYMAQTNYMGDISVVQEALPSSPAVTDEESSAEREDRSLDDLKPDDREESAENDKISDIVETQPEVLGEGKRKFVEEAEKSRADARPSSKDPLKRLLKKIDIQRDRWRSEKRTAKDVEEQLDTDMILPDNLSEISEGTLTMTTEHARSLSVESDTSQPRTTLLHPQEKAERARATSKRIQMPDTTSKNDIEKRKERLQQQKLKLQLQQQQVMQEHLQLQFDALNSEMETKGEQDGSREDSASETKLDSPAVVVHKDKTDANFPDLSSGVLSDDAKTSTSSVPEAGIMMESCEDDALSVPSHATEESRVDANLDRHGVLLSIPESVSEEDFVPLPPVSSTEVFSDVSRTQPLHFVKPPTAKPGVPKLVSTKLPLTRISPPLPLSPPGFLTSQAGQPRFDAPLDERSKKQPLLKISPPHFASHTDRRLDDALPSSQVTSSNVAPSVTKENALVTDDLVQPSATTSVPYDPQQPFLFPKSKPPHQSTSKDIPPESMQERASDSTTPFFRIPSIVSSTPFIAEGQPAFQFPGNNETGTASYLHFYQQQLLEQQTRIREQQEAIQERQQQRLEQLRQFQERLRGQRHDAGITIFGQTQERTRLTGQWQSLIPSTRYPSGDTSSTEHVQSSGESANHVQSSAESLEKPHMEPFTTPKAGIFEDLLNDTSSSLSRYPSEVASTKDNPSLIPKPLDLGMWSDSTPHMSSSDATKSSAATLDDSKSDKRHDPKFPHPKVSYEFGLSSSSSSNNQGNASEENSFNRSSGRSSQKTGSSFDSGTLSLSSLPKSMDKNISTASSGSDSNNNLLQRMETSFQHFQEMIDEAKALNEKYLDEAKHSSNVAVKKSDSIYNVNIGNIENDKEDDVDHMPSSKGYWMSSEPPNNLAKEKKMSDNISRPFIQDTDNSFAEVGTLEQGRRESEDILRDMLGPEEGNFKSDHIEDPSGQRASAKKDKNTKFSSPDNGSSPILTQEQYLGVEKQSPKTDALNVDKEHEPFQYYYESPPRALSVIPEESRLSGDDLSEGVLEEEEESHHINFHEMLNIPEHEKDQANESPSYDETENTHTDVVRQSVEGFQKYTESRDVVRSPSLRHSVSPQARGFYGQQTHATTNYVPYRTPELTQPTFTVHSSEERSRGDSIAIRDKPESHSWRSLSPGGVMTSAEASNKFGLHVDLPTTVERSYSDPNGSPSRNDVVLAGLSSLSLSQSDESSTSGVSLQEALRKSRPEFVSHSKERQRRVKEARYQSPPVMKKSNYKTDANEQNSSPGKTSKILETSPISSKPNAKETVGKQSSDGQYKIGKEEMKERTKRLYENLPDVQQNAVGKKREEMYAANRAKAQEFQKQTRERLRKLNAKKTGRKTKV